MIKDEETRKEYMRFKNRSLINIRLNKEEKSLLETGMSKEGWTSTSGYIKRKLFGKDPEKKIDAIIKGKDTGDILTIIKNEVLNLSAEYIYLTYRYDKDMATLYREEGVDVKKWRQTTNHWHAELAKATSEMFKTLRKIMRALDMDDYERLPSDDIHIDYDTATKEELDAAAEQILRERVAMGGPAKL